jgi:hypothetical protein
MEAWSAAVRHGRQQVLQVLDLDVPVVIRSETGKERGLGRHAGCRAIASIDA